MSMLTPPGMGGRYGKYRLKGDRYGYMGRRRSRGRMVLAACAALTALAVLGWGTLQLIDVFSGNDTARASGNSNGQHSGNGDRRGAACAAKGDKSAKAARAGQDSAKGENAADSKGAGKRILKLPQPREIPVNVYNATEKSGLAKSTAAELKKRGFKIGKVDNAPADLAKKAKRSGMLLGMPGKQTTDRMKVLDLHMKGAGHGYDDRKSGDIDLVLGKGFKKLTPKKDAEQELAALTGTAPKPEPKPKPRPSSTC